MTIRVEIEGRGSVAEFPDGTPQSVIDAAIKRDFFGPASRPRAKDAVIPETQSATPAWAKHPMTQAVIGAGKGIINTLANAPVLPVLGAPNLLDIAETAGEDTSHFRSALEPENTPQKVGRFVETAAEFAGGEAAVAKAATKVAPALAKTPTALRSIAGAVGGAGVTAVQGGDAKEIATNAAVGGVASWAFKALGKGIKALGQKIQTSVIRPTLQDIRDGFNIATLEKYNLGGTLEASARKTAAAIQERAAALKAELQAASTAGRGGSYEPFTAELQQRVAAAPNMTDDEITALVRELGSRHGVPVATDRPVVYYRAIPDGPANALDRGTGSLEQFTWVQPGQPRRGLPFSYGGKTPQLNRIIDPFGNWRDTGSGGPAWLEAVNDAPVNVRPMHAGKFQSRDLYRQVATEADDGVLVPQKTYVTEPADSTTDTLGVQVDLHKALKDTEAELMANPGEHFGKMSGIKGALQRFSGEITATTPTGQADILTAQRVKRGVGNLGAWKFGHRDDDGATEAVANVFYTKMRQAIEAASGGGRVGAINAELSELIPVENAIIRRIPVAARNNTMGLGQIIALTHGNALLVAADLAQKSGNVGAGLNASGKALGGGMPKMTALAQAGVLTADPFGHDRAVEDATAEVQQQAGGDSTVARQIMGDKRQVYIGPDGTETPVPASIALAFANGDKKDTLNKWLGAMKKQGKIKPGGRLQFVDGATQKAGDGHEFPMSPERKKLFTGSDGRMRNPAMLIPEGYQGPHTVDRRTAGDPGVPFSAEYMRERELRGVYGMNFQTGRHDPSRSNTILMAPEAANHFPDVIHEMGHSIDMTGLREDQRAAFSNRFVQQAAAFRALMASPRAPSRQEVLAQITGRAPYTIGIPLAIVRYYLQMAASPRFTQAAAEREAFAEMSGQFFSNPEAFRRAYPEDYELMRGIVASGHRQR